MKIPFSYKYRQQIESGEYKLVTELGSPAVVVDWDWVYNDVHGAAIKVPGKHCDNAYFYDQDGRERTISGTKIFVIVPDQEQTEFEKACINLYQNGRDDGFSGNNLSNEALKESAAELLHLAEIEIMDSGRRLPRWQNEQKSVEITDEWIENYWKHHKEALEIAKIVIENCYHEEAKTACREIFPELMESEDERVRKWIVDLIHNREYSEDEHPMALKAIEWLERQKEQQPLSTEEIVAWLKSLRPQPCWKPSEEEMDALGRCVDYLEESDNGDAAILGSLLHNLMQL